MQIFEKTSAKFINTEGWHEETAQHAQQATNTDFAAQRACCERASCSSPVPFLYTGRQ
jgi:hypothetical protein